LVSDEAEVVKKDQSQKGRHTIHVVNLCTLIPRDHANCGDT